MKNFNRVFKSYYLGLFILLSFSLTSCSNDDDDNSIANSVIENFRTSTGINAISITDTALLNTVKGWQGQGDYPGVDNWEIATIPAGLDLYGGLPGQSEYYTIGQTIIDADTMKAPYWESLQVKAHPTFGYRPMVGVFDVKENITVAIAKTLKNPQFGDGGAWQIYVADYGLDLTVMDTLYLKE